MNKVRERVKQRAVEAAGVVKRTLKRVDPEHVLLAVIALNASLAVRNSQAYVRNSKKNTN